MAFPVALYAFVIGFATRRGRRIIIAFCAEIGVGTPRGLAPSVPATDLLKSFDQVTLQHLAAIPGNVPLLELAVLVGLVQYRQPAVVFEIGTYDGRTTLNLATASPRGATIHTLDQATGPPSRGMRPRTPTEIPSLTASASRKTGETSFSTPALTVQTSHVLTNLDPATAYDIRIIADDGVDTSAPGTPSRC